MAAFCSTSKVTPSELRSEIVVVVVVVDLEEDGLVRVSWSIRVVASSDDIVL